MSPNERLNNIILEYNTTQPQNSTAKESNAASEIESTLKEIACSRAHMFVTCIVTCLTYSTSLLAVTIVNNFAWHAPAKIKWGDHFCVLTGMWVFQTTTYTGHLTLHSHATKVGLCSTSSNATKNTVRKVKVQDAKQSTVMQNQNASYTVFWKPMSL